MKKMICAIVALSMFSEARAEGVYRVTYSGTVSQGYDVLGWFGQMFVRLDGLPFTSQFVFSTPMPGALLYGDETTSYIAGGQMLGRPSPVSATLNINGVSQAIPGTYYGIAFQKNSENGGIDKIYHSASFTHPYYNRGVSFEISSSQVNFLNSNSIESPIDYLVEDGVSAFGGFDFDLPELDGRGRAAGGLKVTRISIARISASVPEPSTWVMTLIGFGILGATMRGRRAMTCQA